MNRTWLILALACTPLEQTPDFAPADPAAILVRASLDLRGIRPSLDDLDRLASDPSALDELIDEYLADPRFGPRMSDLYAEVLLSRGEVWPVNAQSYGAVDPVRFVASVGDEVPRMVGHVAANDLPWTELVVGDWTMADDLLRSIWPVQSIDPSARDWAPARYTDGRPAAGALAANSLWWRYGSTFSNANRKRANAVSRIFLCNDYLHRAIDFDRSVNLLDQGAVDDALRTNPGCVSCHASLDPLSGHFYGFWHVNTNSAAEVTRYHPERELLWRDISGVEPGYYGSPSASLRDLGLKIAADPRYPQCAVETFTAQLLRRPVTLADEDRLVAHREAFLQGGLTVRALVRSVIDSPEYRAGPTDDPRAVPRKLVTADLLHDQIEGLTGFRWTAQGGRDLLRSEQVQTGHSRSLRDRRPELTWHKFTNCANVAGNYRYALAAALGHDGDVFRSPLAPSRERNPVHHITLPEIDALPSSKYTSRFMRYGERITVSEFDITQGVEPNVPRPT